MAIIMENDLRILKDGYGPHSEKRYEIWEKGKEFDGGKMPDKLEWWSSNRAAAIEHFEIVKDLPRYKAPKAGWEWLN